MVAYAPATKLMNEFQVKPNERLSKRGYNKPAIAILNRFTVQGVVDFHQSK